ncbi:exodeoxyribonuclease III [Candidatus Peregrinibacteria bacterium]|nr:exodeoxyribonuclease III [Candidatus Peregrinibacteria bacterium]
MKHIKIFSWNVNGVRAAMRNGFLKWLHKEQPDIVCIQETKALQNQLPKELIHPDGYHTFWHSADLKKGYSGTAIFTKYPPLRVSSGLKIPEFDREGRTLKAEFSDFILYNVYFPNGKASPGRLDFKMKFYEAFQKVVSQELNEGKKIIICGDVNTAHKEIDLARPKENMEISGFLPMERAWIDRFLQCGFCDILRSFHQEPHLYTWWSLRSGARERNVGWRIDYFYVSKNIKTRVSDAFILPNVIGSDHCPLGITVEISEKFLTRAVINDTVTDDTVTDDTAKDYAITDDPENLAGKIPLQPFLL